MRPLAFLLALLATACAEPPPAPPGVLQGPVSYRQADGALLACTTRGFETIGRRG